jgi:ribose transport system substrate-binding protein
MTLHRRKFLGLSAAAAAAATTGLNLSPAFAQDATPEAGGTPADPMTAYGPVQGNSAYKLAFMQVYPSQPFWQIMNDAIVARAAEDGVTVDVIALPDASGVADQVSQFEDAVTQGYDGIIMGTVDAAGIVQGVEAANAAGIPVIAVDTAPAGGELVSLIQTDNVAAAKQQGEYIAELIGGKGKVLNLQGDMANQTAQARNEGLHAALDAYPDITVIDQSAHWQQTEGLSITENILTSDPDIVAIAGANDPPILGALQALVAAGRDDVALVGFDAIPDVVQAIIDGSVAGTVAQFPMVMGTVGVDLMTRHLNGEEVPAKVDSGALLVTADNAAQFQADQA